MKGSVAVLLALLALLATVTVRASQTASAQQSPDVDQRILDALEAGEEVEIVVMAESSPSIVPPGMRLQTNAQRRSQLRSLAPAADVVAELQSVPSVTLRIDSIEQLQALQADSSVSSVTFGGHQAIRHLNESRIITRAADSHAQGVRGAGYTVAVIDSGYDRDHPDLADSLVFEVCYIKTDHCPNGQATQFGPGAATDDSIAHGTRVSGIIASNGEISPVGIAPDAEVVSFKIFDGVNGGWLSDIALSLDYILTSRPEVDVVNMSLGYVDQYAGTCDADFPDIAALVDQLRARGVVVVASAGNDPVATMGAPACVTGVISVAASDGITGSDTYGEITDFSSVSPVTDVAAPGAQVITTDDGGGATVAGGTSFAAPTAAACAVLLMEHGFDSSAEQVEARLRTSPVVASRPGSSLPVTDCGPSTLAVGGGDVDCSGAFNINDARLLTLYAVALVTDGGNCDEVGPGEIQASVGDLDRNGFVNIADARIASLCAVGLDDPNC